MIIDGHIHVGSWRYKYYHSLLPDIKYLNNLLEKCGIEGAIIIPSDKKENEKILKDIKSNGKKKYWFFPWCDPRDRNCMKFLHKNLKYINGLKIHSSLDKVRGGVANSLYKPFLELGACQKIPIFVHCGRWQEYASYKFIFKVAEKYQNIKFIMSHLGGDFEGLKIEAPRKLRKIGIDNVWIDISATREFWTIKMGIEEVGYKKFIFGSDFPVMHPKMSIVSIEELNLSNAHKRWIFSKNILKVLGNKNLPITGGENDR